MGENETAMDASLQQFFHKIEKRKLKVRIGSVQEELKLVVKVDKSLVDIPAQQRRNHKDKRIKKEERYRKVENDSPKLHNKLGPTSWRHPCVLWRRSHALISKPVDSTLLVDLADYAKLPFDRKRINRISQIVKPSLALDSKSSHVKQEFASFDEEEGQKKSDTLVERNLKQVTVSAFAQGQTYFPVLPLLHTGYLSKMEYDKCTGIRECSSSSTVDDVTTSKENMIVESPVNNNEPDLEDKAITNSELWSEGNDDSCRVQEELVTNVKPSNDIPCNISVHGKEHTPNATLVTNSHSNNSTAINLDQTVPQMPTDGQCNEMEPEQMTDSQTIPKESNLQEKKSYIGMSNIQTETVIENEQKINSTMTHGDIEVREEHRETETSSSRSIGERVDDEIKALLGGEVHSEVSLEGKANGNKNDSSSIIQSFKLTHRVEGEARNMADDDLKKGTGTNNLGDAIDVEECRTEATDDKEDGMGNVEETEVHEQPGKQKLILAETKIKLENVSDEAIIQQGEDCSRNLVDGDQDVDENACVKTTQLEKVSQQLHSPGSHPDQENISEPNPSSSDEQSIIEAESNCITPSDTNVKSKQNIGMTGNNVDAFKSSHEFGRKGLKQQQSVSPLDAEVTSQQAEFIPPIKHCSSGTPDAYHDEPQKLPKVNEARSQSVIVSNPRSLPQLEVEESFTENNYQTRKTNDEDARCHIKSDKTEENNKDVPKSMQMITDKQVQYTVDTHVEYPELFQVLTPPPPSFSVERSNRNERPHNYNRQTDKSIHDMRQQGIQITSVRTLAPLTANDIPETPPTVDVLVKQGHVTYDRKEQPNAFLEHKEMLKPNVTLHGPPVSSLHSVQGPVDASSNVMQAHHSHVVDLSKDVRVPSFTLANERDIVHQMIPRTSETNEGVFLTQGHSTYIEETMSPIDYNPEKQQQHFMEIKRHLLTSKVNAQQNEIVSMPRIVPVSNNIPCTRPIITVAPVTQKVTLSSDVIELSRDGSNLPSPLGKFSGAMMEHVKHWKEQNERITQANLSNATKISPNLVPVDAIRHPMICPTMIPSNCVATEVSMDPTAMAVKHEKVLEGPGGDINSALLENLQAIHKMYFKTMQGGEKVIFPKMPVKQTVGSPSGAMPEMVQVVKPFIPPPMQPQMIPRFPGNGPIPPEIMNIHRNIVARSIPGPPQISPPEQHIFQPRMTQGVAPESHQLRFPEMNGCFPQMNAYIPRPFPVPQIERFPKTMGSNAEQTMVSQLSPFPLSPKPHLHGKPRGFLGEFMKPSTISPTLPPNIPMMLLSPGSKFPEKLPETSVVSSISLEHQKPKMIFVGAKRNMPDVTPIDLSTKSAKVRRICSSETLHDQPIDLSVKTKPSEEEKREEISHSQPEQAPTMTGMPVPGFAYPSLVPPNSMGFPANDEVAAKNLPQKFMVPFQYLRAPMVQRGLANLPTTHPQRMRLPSMNNSKAQVVPHHITLSATSPPQMMHVSNQPHLHFGMNRMPSDPVEIMKLVAGGNTGQTFSNNIKTFNQLKPEVPHNIPPHLMPHASLMNSVPHREAAQPVSEANLEHGPILKRKRGRPKGSTNKKRFQAELPPPLQVVEHPTNVVPVSAPSEIAECQFCDFKAASRGDVRQHVKAVHFAKFRRDSTKSVGSSEVMTPISEYSPVGGHPIVVSSPEEKVEWTALSADRTEVKPDVNPPHGKRSALVIDVSPGDSSCIKDEIQTPGESNVKLDPRQGSAGQESAYPRGEGDKPPLKITLRRISSTSTSEGGNPVLFSTTPEKPPEKKPKFVCQTCGASYNYVNGLREHESRHRVDLPFECEVCHLKYKTMGMLSRHQAQKNHQT